MVEEAFLQETYFSITKITDDKSVIAIHSKEQLLKWLSEKIQQFIDQDFQKLITILYRVDVDENKAKQLLSQHNPSESAKVLAALIIQREMEKVKNKKNQDWKEV